VLFAVNERWFVNEKGAVGEAAALSGLRPEPAPLEAALEAMAALTATVRERCAG
jgi:hypothetical protein